MPVGLTPTDASHDAAIADEARTAARGRHGAMSPTNRQPIIKKA
jgi:hypothetical protein